MSPTTKTVLILEDMDDQREPLRALLERGGFHVKDAANIEAARAALSDLGMAPDVLLLDMKLGKSTLTGADFGIEARARWRAWPAECLIMSAYNDVPYYRLAIELGAATYLEKPVDGTDVVRHVRALTLRRAFQPGRPGLEARIRDIVRDSAAPGAALDAFCSQVVHPELAATLGRPFVLLLSEGHNTRALASGVHLPPTASIALDHIQHAVHGELAADRPLVVDWREIPVDGTADARETMARTLHALDGAVFIPLSERGEIKLSLGLPPVADANAVDEDDAERLATVIGGYLRRVFLTHMLQIIHHWSEQRRELLRSTSTFCLYAAQELESARGELPKAEDAGPGASGIERITALARDLHLTGELLVALDPDAHGDSGDGGPLPEHVDVAGLVRDVWAKVAARLHADEALVQIKGEGRALVRRERMELALDRLLAWLTRRCELTPRGTDPAIVVELQATGERCRVSIEDHSRRLPRELRAKLLLPFETEVVEPPEADGEGTYGHRLGLYLTKALIEAEPGGVIADRSDDIDGGHGHRFVIELAGGIPAEQAATPAVASAR